MNALLELKTCGLIFQVPLLSLYLQQALQETHQMSTS